MGNAIIELKGDLAKIVSGAFPSGALKAALNRAVTVAGVDARSFMIDRCPVSDAWQFTGKGKIGRRPSGRLKNSLQGGVDGIWRHDTGQISQTIGSNVKYADAIISQDGEHSGGPYVIRPKNKKWLVFPIGPNPKTDIVRTAKVTHPGAKEIARRKTGKSVAIMTQAKDWVEARGEIYVKNAVKATMEIFR